MSLLSKLTLIIPTYNRHSFAIRSLQYWSGTGVNVHILDGSQEPVDADCMKKLSSDVHYHHFPVSVIERLKIGSELADTPYTILLGDDEFFFPSALEACINELESDPALVSCMGRSLGFRQMKTGIAGWNEYIDQKNYLLLQDNPGERMIYHMRHYTCSTIYSVVRTNAWKTAMSILPMHKFNVFGIEEYQFEMAIAFLGKSKVIPVLMWLRSFENSSMSGNGVTINFYRWWGRKSNMSDCDIFIDNQVATLALATGMDKKLIRPYVMEASNAFAGWQKNVYDVSFFKNPYLYLATRLPFSFKQKFKILIDMIKGVRILKEPVFPETPFITVAQLMERDEQVAINLTEINKVVGILEAYHGVTK